jgi:Transglycosylase SLT domain
MASVRRLDPLFVYAIVKAESDFDPHAKRGEARGLMQIKPRAWRAVSDLPYETVVWDWRSNLAVGMDALASLKRTLTAKGVFSYPVLWAAYHYGLDYTAAHDFDMSRIPKPSDPISFKLWSGDSHPLAPPL